MHPADDYRPTDAFPDVAYVRYMTDAYAVPQRVLLGDPALQPRLIGLIGKKRAGKDTFARGLIERGAVRFAFADNVRQGALDLDPLIRFEHDEAFLAAPGMAHVTAREGSYERLSTIVERLGWEQAKEIREVRRTLQRFGSESIRRLDPDFWVRTAMGAATAHVADGGVAVLTDVRFENEAGAVREAGGFLIRIIRPGMPSDDQHPSEIALDGFEADLDVLNVADAEALIRTARLLPL